MKQKWQICLDAKHRPHCCPRRLMIKFPHFNSRTLRISRHISIVDVVNSVKYLGIRSRSLQLYVFRMRPQERHSRARWTTEVEKLQRRIRTIPNLLRNQSNALREVLNCTQERSSVMSRGDFVVTALAGQQWPWTTLAPTRVPGPVIALAKAIMIIPAPARSIRRVHFEHRIDDAKRIFDERMVRAANTVTNQLEKTAVDNLFPGKFN